MKQIIHTQEAPDPVGPYNQAVLIDRLLFVSGQIALDPGTGQLILSDIETETHRVMQNLAAILKQSGCTFRDVVKCTVYVRDMTLYTRINSVYAAYFEDAWAPARELVEVSQLPKSVNVEISLIAFRPA